MNPADRKSRKKWLRDLPAFLDAASSVSSATFGARRLPELKALWSQVRGHNCVIDRLDEPFQSAGHKTSTRHLRRRTTSHASRKRHRYPLGYPEDGLSSKSAATKILSRKSRRKPSLLRIDHSSWQRKDENVTSKVHWLPTHLWHAKRFHMHDMFGWRVPLKHTNRGSRAVYRLLREGRTTLQDISWRMQPIVIGTNDLKLLVECMTRLCPEFLPKSHVLDLLDGRRFGAGVLHEPDAFPTKAIGPATWWIRPIESNISVTHEMYLFLHPSFRPRMEEILRGFSQISNLAVPSRIDGIACFQLHGTSVADAVMESLQIKEEDGNAVKSTECLAVLHVVLGVGSKPLPPPLITRPFDMKSNEIILVRQEEICGEFSGWYLICSVSDAHHIFLTLSHHALMVPVGYAEETHMGLSVDPPSALFPAAYPDSEQGRRYWEGSADWKVLRSFCESGHGRIQASRKVDSSVMMSELLRLASPMGTSDDNAADRPVVVRGVFGQPFVDLLQQCARLPPQALHEQSKQRRPRRKHIRPDVVKLACRVSNDEARSRIGRVSSLANSLSLAALIRCKIQVYGRGTLEQGDFIFGRSTEKGDAFSDRSKEIGVVVEGSFSGDQGLVQGYGFISAAKLLAFLMNCVHPDMMRNDGALSLIVELRRGTTSTICLGTVSLLL